MGVVPDKQKIVVAKIERFNARRMYCFWKRLFDIFFSFLFIVVAAVPMAIISLIIVLNGGPAIFKQERLGLNAKPFTIYKFRTMIANAEVNGAKWAEKNDPRVTRFGRFLRKTQIDEWPQFFNILGGSMSFVGPRPEVKSLHDEFCRYVIGFEQRLLVKPGLTGWAQINGGAALLPEQKVVFDIEYIQRRSLWFDFICVVRTIGVVLNPKGY